MKTSYTRMKVLAAMSLLAVALGACGSGTTSSSAPGGSGTTSSSAPGGSGTTSSSAPGGSIDSTTPVTLNIWGAYPEMDAVYKKAGEAYTAKHPNVTFTVFSTDRRGFEQKLTTAIPSKTAGDVIIETSFFLTRFLDQGLFSEAPADIASFVKGGAYLPFTLNDVTYNDKIWSVPTFLGREALYYNTDMLAEAGLSGPPKTMDEIVQYAHKLAKADASGNVTRSGLSLRLSGQGSGVAEKFWSWLEQYGKGLIKETSPGKWQADYNNDEGVKTFQMYVDLLRDKVDDPKIASDAKAFETKATAMFVRESWVIREIATKAPDLVGHYGTINLPGASISQTEGAFVPAASPNQAVAWDFIKFLAEPEQQLSIATIAGWLPARSDLDVTEFLKANPGYEGYLHLPDNYRFFGGPKLPEFDELETKIATHLVEAYTDPTLAGNPDKIRAMLDTWAAETNDVLKKGGHYDG